MLDVHWLGKFFVFYLLIGQNFFDILVIYVMKKQLPTLEVIHLDLMKLMHKIS